MRSTMQQTPLLIARILRYGSTVHAASEVVTWTASGTPRRTTYGEIGRDAARLAHALRGLGITGDQRVATFMWNDAEHLQAYLAVPAMGAVCHTLNIRLSPDQLAYIATHAEDKVVIVDSSLVPLLAKVLPQMPTVEHVLVNDPEGSADVSLLEQAGKTIHSYQRLLAGQPDTFDWPDLDENEAAALCYTSGTTGKPKGVAYSHRSIYLHSMQVATGDALALSQADKMLPVVPMFHASAWGMPYASFMVGASLLMPERFLQAAPLAAMIAAERPTVAAAVPTIWSDVLTYLDANHTDVSSLRDVVIGGAACPPALMRGFEERHGVRVIHAWGMTETSPLGSLARPPAGVDAETAWAYRASQGRFLCSVEARLVGPDGSLVPFDGQSVGEVEVRGPWITGSYFRDDDPTKFDDGWLRTGDVGRVTADGFMTLTDRAKDVIKSGGEWISSVELENLLMAHPAVKEASVVGVPDERWGERPLATVVVREGQQVDAAQLAAFLTAKLPSWQVPERWSFIDEVPKTSVGKFDKKVLRQRYADGVLEVKSLR